MAKPKRRDHRRGANTHRRRKGNRKAGESILIVCEGETEPIYFKELLYQVTGKHALPLVQIESAEAGHTAVTKKAKKLQKKRKKEDVIRHTEEAIKRAEKILDNKLDAHDPYPNPSTHVHKLVQILLDQYNKTNK